MPPKDSKKRDAEDAPATENLRRSTRGGGHAAPPPKASKPASSASKAKKAKTDASAPAAENKDEEEQASKDADAAAPPATAAAANGAKDDANGAGVAVPEQNKEIAAEVESKKKPSSSSSSASKRIEVGETLPEGLVLKNEKDEEVTISDLTKDKGAVFFVYPKANTPGCTTQACNFRDNYAEFGPLGYDVYGLSGDSPKSQANWKTKNNFPYTLLCDPGQILLKLLGAAKSAGSNQRSHYVVAKGGKLVDAKYTVSPKDSHVLALEAIKKEQK